MSDEPEQEEAEYASYIAQMEGERYEVIEQGVVENEKPHKKHWYFITHFECPVCGSGKEYRERRYTKRPKRYDKRHEWLTDYDWCNEGGMF